MTYDKAWDRATLSLAPPHLRRDRDLIVSTAGADARMWPGRRTLVIYNARKHAEALERELPELIGRIRLTADQLVLL